MSSVCHIGTYSGTSFLSWGHGPGLSGGGRDSCSSANHTGASSTCHLHFFSEYSRHEVTDFSAGSVECFFVASSGVSVSLKSK